MAHQACAAHARKDVRAIGPGVVGEQPSDAQAAPAKPAQRPPEKSGAGWGVASSQDFHIRQPRRIIDRDVEKFVAHAAGAAPAIAVNAMADAPDAAQPLEIHMQQIAAVRPLIALDGRPARAALGD